MCEYSTMPRYPRLRQPIGLAVSIVKTGTTTVSRTTTVSDTGTTTERQRCRIPKSQTSEATKWRHDVAMGASPWNVALREEIIESRRDGRRLPGCWPVAPSGLQSDGAACFHGLAPVATSCRPFGTESKGTKTNVNGVERKRERKRCRT